MGQLHNFFRLFERAFAAGPNNCVAPLLALLQAGPGNLHWSQAEILDWFQRLRPEATHADRRDTYARAPDVEPFLGRIEYAAFDVLLNKATWRRPDGVRRSVLDLAAGLDSDKSTVALRKADTTVIFPWIDPFGLFPIDFNVHPHVGPPVVTNMPGFTQEDEAVFIARMKIRNDFSSGETYDLEVLTKHESTPAEGE